LSSLLEITDAPRVSHTAAFSEVADFLRQVLGMITGALQALGYQDDVDGFGAGLLFPAFEIA
jgi:hypothetical protein